MLHINIIIIITFISTVNTGPIYYEKPSSGRLAAATHTPPACTYQGRKYAHGLQVPTPEPCLNCTCRKGVLLCFLRVCPTLIQTSPNDNCRTVREPDQCCPVLKCESLSVTTADSYTTTPAVTTNQSNEISDLTTESPTYDSNKLVYIPDYPKNIEKSISNKIDNRVSVTQKDRTTTIFQTSPSTTFHDSHLFVTSSPSQSISDNQQTFVANYEGNCLLNGTVYAEGSAVISSSFCEYCYCIRSKRMCIRPRCHLSILGCLPRYTSQYACCPTSYVCGDEALTTLPMTTTTTTTTTTTMSTESIRIFGRKAACVVDGIEYKVGDPMASDEHCKQCYCSLGGIKKCKTIECSPQMDGCVAVIPDGHCCPVEYKCNTTIQTSTENLMSFNTETTAKPTLTTLITHQTSTESTEVVTDFNNNFKNTNNELNTTKNNFQEIVDTTVSDNTSNTTNTLNDDISNIETTTLSTIKLESAVNSSNITIQMENGQQLRKEDLIVNQNYDIIKNSDNNNLNPTTTPISFISIETTTNGVFEVITDPIEYQPSAEAYIQNDTIVNNKFESNTLTTTLIPLTSVITTQSEKLITSEPNVLTTVLNDTNIKDIDKSAKSDDQNGTAFDSMHQFLKGIINVIDSQLHKHIPLEPKIKNNSLTNELVNKQINTNKHLTARSDSKTGPSLSSSFLINDDNNEMPYKSDSGVEIITAKTAFYDFDESPGQSILINLTPGSMKVSSSTVNQSSSPTNDKNYDVLAQNNRATVYGKPLQSNYQHFVQPNNDWRVVNSNFARKPMFEESPESHKPVESLYLSNQDIRRHDMDVILDQNGPDFDKKPRLEFENSSNRMKVIPFKVNDALNSQLQKKKNGSFLIRLSPTKPPATPNSTPKSSQQISCIYNSIEYPNGATIPKPDPCTLCRCFYGQELCQQQKCPGPPEKDCVPEKMSGYCCPRYICRISEDSKASQKPSKVEGVVNQMNPIQDISNVSPVRKGPQFSADVNNINTNNTSITNSFNNDKISSENLPQNKLDNKHTNEDKHSQVVSEGSGGIGVQSLATNILPPQPLQPQLLEVTPKPFQRISGFNLGHKKQTENRIHFPVGGDSGHNNPFVSQPILTDAMTAMSPQNSPVFAHKPPHKPIINPLHNQYNNANKFRLKPAPIMNQATGPQLSLGSPQNPNLRIPPFLLPNTPSVNNIRHKPPNIVSTVQSDVNHSKPEIKNISIAIINENKIPIVTSNETNTRPIQLTSHLPELDQLSTTTTTTTAKPTFSTTKTQSLTQSTDEVLLMKTSSTTTTTTTTIPKNIPNVENSDKNKNHNSWDLFRVSGCNIYGIMYQIDQQIDKLSTPCKKCVCSAQGVNCSDIC